MLDVLIELLIVISDIPKMYLQPIELLVQLLHLNNLRRRQS